MTMVMCHVTEHCKRACDSSDLYKRITMLKGPQTLPDGVMGFWRVLAGGYLYRWHQSRVQLHKITSITITITLKYQLQLQLHHHKVILNYNYNYTMFISITITVPFLPKWYFSMMEFWVNRFGLFSRFGLSTDLVTLPPLSLATLCGFIISRHLISYMCGTTELDHTK